jgi:6-phosphogluconate dehydrogenase
MTGLRDLLRLPSPGDILTERGNSYSTDHIRRLKELAPEGIHYVKAATSAAFAVWSAATA